MSRPPPRAAAALLVLAACTDSGTAAAPDAGAADARQEVATICHIPTADPAHPVLLEVPERDVAAHVAHGDPAGVAAALVYVDARVGTGGLGTTDRPFGRATDALALMRCRQKATGEAGEVRFAPGLHRVSFDAAVLAANPSYEPGPLIVDFPVKLRGATTVALDAGGRPSPDHDRYTPASATFLAAAAPLGPDDLQTLILVADTHDVVVEGFVLVSGHCRQSSLCPGQATVTTWGGAGVEAVRSDDFEVRGNVMQPGFTAAVEAIGASGAIRGNYASDTAICVACVNGPGRVEISGNRFDAGLGGVLAGPSIGDLPFSLGPRAEAFSIAQFTSPAEPTLELSVVDNVLSGHTRNATAFGIRLVVYGRATEPIVERQVLTARVRGNRVAADDGGVGASQGLLIDAGFSDRLDDRALAGTMFVDATDNTFKVSGAPIAVMTMRAQALLANATVWKSFKPLARATLVVDSDVAYPDGFRVDHLAADPLSGQTRSGTPCAADADCSTARYRGQALPGACDSAAGRCKCLPGLTDMSGTCTDPTPLDNVVVINGKAIAPGTILP